MISTLSPSSKPIDTYDTYEGNGIEELKERLVREVRKNIQKREPISLLWPKLQKETGIDCKQLWNHMRDSTVKKLTTLLEANDLLNDVPIPMRLSAADWLLFDMVLVHEQINVIDFEKLPECIRTLYDLVTEHEVEDLVGDELIRAWICITKQYNKGGRQCSPMLLQLRWYQLKVLLRKQIYKPVMAQSTTKTNFLREIAVEHQNIITQPLPIWEILIEKKLVILPEQFLELLNRGQLCEELEEREGWYLQLKEDSVNKTDEDKTEIAMAVRSITDSDNDRYANW